MLNQSKQTTLSFHAELYDIIVPKNHLLRQIHEIIDFSFVHDIVKSSYCEFYGRPANEPELLFRLLFLQTLSNLSDERIIKEAQVNMAYKWFLGLNPEDSLPDSSQLSRFRKHRLGAQNIEKVLTEIVKQAQEKGLIRSKALFIDSTHTLANAAKKKPLEVLSKAASRLRRTVRKQHKNLYDKLPAYPTFPKEISEEEKGKIMISYLALLGETVERALPDAEGAVKEKLKVAKQIIEDERLLANKGIRSAIDPDARFGWKSVSRSFFGYKSHIAMTEEEIITQVKVTTGTGDDGKQLKELVNQTKAQALEVNEILADTAYSSKANLNYLDGEEIIATIPLNPSVYGTREDDCFRYDKETDQVMCPAGHWSIRKARQGKKDIGQNQFNSFFFDTSICKTCPMKEGCYKKGSKTKTYSIRIISDEHQNQMNYLATEEYKIRSKKRGIIEHKNAELKRYHGLTTAKYCGLFGMIIQSHLSAITVNIKRIVKLNQKYSLS